MVKNQKVLIVEDELIIAKSLARQLKQLGYEVVGIAANGEKALEIVEASSPDLIFMDVVIAGEMDGIETAKRIQKIKNISVIYVTAYGDESTLRRIQESGYTEYILKPYQKQENEEAIIMALND
ncbi:UNVERIFIED_CONTAM: response regulator receiver protein [Euhalothece sp. KZN 001]